MRISDWSSDVCSSDLCLTEWSIESTYNALQCFGGHGYVREWGMEQLARDARITTIYEGTTQIQALDLLGRKVLQTQGPGLQHLAAEQVDRKSTRLNSSH